MNKIYKVIWSKVRNCYVAVSEIAKRNGKSCTSVNCGAKANRGHAGMALSAIVGATLLAGVCSVLLPVRVALAATLPTLDYKGASAYVTIDDKTTANTMNISSTKPNNVLKWIDFSIDKGGTVQFDTRNYLNYVTGHGRSEIDGTLKGAGNIYLINPNGILFGSNASVDVGNLYLSTRKLTDSELTNFTNSGTNPLDNPSSYVLGSEIINLGRLKATNIIVEGKNITFKNVADVTPTNTINVRAKTDGGEVRVGYAASSVVNAVNTTEYTNGHITQPNLSKWIFKNEASETIEPTKYMLVRNAYELQNMQNNKSSSTSGTWTYVDYVGNFMLANDIDFNGTTFSPGFKPIGYNDETNKIEYRFTGKFDGLNYKIKNLKITDGTDGTAVTLPADVSDSIGLFGINRGTIENLGVENTTINVSKNSVGGVVGTNYGVVRNVYHTGSVKGAGNVGGIVGDSASYGSEAIKASYNTGNVTGTNYVGGIAGYQSTTAKIEVVFNEGSVNGGEYVGGIAGTAKNVYNSYNTGEVKGTDYVGGITGKFNNNYLQKSYNVGKVTGTTHAGGIAGSDGTAQYESRITNCVFSKGPDNGIGTYVEDEANMKKRNTFSGFSMTTSGNTIGSIWRIYEGQTIPFLAAFLKNKDVVTATEYNGAEQSFVMPSDSHILGSVSISRTSAGRVTKNNVLYSSDQLGYDLFDTVLLIQPKQLTIGNVSKEYDGTTAATLAVDNLAGVVNGDATDLTVTTTSATYNTKNVGTGRTVTYNDIKLGGDKKNNYIIVDSATGTGSITAKPLTVGNVTKVYDGEATAPTLTVANLQGVVDGDATGLSISSGVTANYTGDKAADAETGKTVEYSGLTISGTASGNYTIAESGTSTTGNSITPKQLSATFNTISKVYDGGTSGTANASLTGVVGSDDVSVTATATYLGQDVGTWGVNYTGIGLTGNQAGNYVLDSTSAADKTVEGNSITAKALTVGNISKVYDGTAEAKLTLDNLIGLVDGDKTSLSISEDVTANYTGEKAADAGTGKTVEYSGLIFGGDKKDNYSIATSGTSTKGNSIEARPLTMGSVSKVYDGTDNALVSVYALTNAIEDDLLDLSFKETSSGKYNDGKNVGDNLTVTYTGLILEGAKAGNYTIVDSNPVVPGNSITPKELTLVADKVTIKSGETVPPFTGNIIGFVEGERLASEDDLKFALAGTEPTMAGSYAIVGKLKDSASGNYQENGVYKAKDNTFANYTFSNAPANEKAFTIAVDVMPQLDFRGASADVTIDSTTIANTMAISSIKSNNVLKWIDFSIGSGGTVQFDAKNYLNYVTGHGRSEIYGTLTGGGDIYLINPNGMLFGSTAQVNVGNLYLSTRSFDVDDELDDKLNDYLNNRTIPTGSTILGDVTNLGKLNTNGVVNPNTNVLTNTIEVEGKNISIKNIADVTTGGTLTNGTLSGGSMHNNVKLTSGDGEIHLGFAVSDTPAEGVNDTQYTNVTPPSLEGWTTTGTTHKYMLVHNAYELQNINNNLTGNYMLANDINFTKENGDWIIKDFKSLGSKGNNWGSRPGMFQGRLDGLNHVIRNINITNKNNESYSTDVGLIGSNAGIVENFGVVNGNIVLSSKSWVGGIVGANKGCGIIRNVYFSGLVEGNRNVGGIAGAQDGYNTQPGVPLPGGIIEKAYVSGTVRSNSSNGGSNVGGIVGSNANGARVSEAYNSANVSTKAGGNYIGGIAGTNNGTIINAYNTGTIEGGTYVGGIAGSNSSNGSIQNTYNTGTVSGTSNEGGIVGYNSGTAPIISSFFTQGNNNGKGTQISDESKLKEFDTFAGSSLAASKRWDMSKTGGAGTVWRIYEGQTGPLLTAFLKTKDVVTATEYNGEEQTFDNTLAQGSANHIYATESGNLVKGTDAKKYFGNNTDNNNSGYKVYYSDQGGYDIGDTILVIQPKKLSIADVSKVYDGNQNVIYEISINGKVGNDEVNLDSNKVTGVYEDKNAGTDKTVTYTVNTGALTGTDANNYSIASIVTGSGTITAKELSLVHASKVYDGTTDVEASDIVLATDIIENDNVVFDSSKVTGVYEDKNVNDSGSKAITYTVSTGALTGTDAGNYSIGTAGTGDITKANVTLTVEDVVKTYDGTTEVTGKTLMVKPGSGTIFASDSLSGGTFAFTDKNVGTGNKEVTVTGGTITDATSGADTSGNYSITYEKNTTSTINKADVTLTVEDVTKTYDGTTTVTGKTLMVKPGSGTIFVSDSLSGGTFAFADKNVGTGNKKVTVAGGTITDTTSGADTSGNYNITYEDNTTSTINKANVTLTVEDVTKTYDGTTAVTGKTLMVKPGSGTIFASDSLSGGTFAFTDKNVGTGNKEVTVTGGTITDTTSGADTSGNYNVTYVNNTTSTINKADLTLTAEDVVKIYDGTTAVTGGTLKVHSGTLFAGDSISGGTFAFTDKNAGTGNKTVTVSDATVTDGNSGGNYNVTYADNTTSTINKADLTLTAEDVVKTYDGTTAVTGGTLKVLSGTLFTGDSIGGGTFAFTDKNAGTGNKIVTVTDATISDGNGGGNYNVTYSNNTTSTINKKALTATFADISKTYDGTTNATPGAGTLTGVVAVDAGKVSVSASAAYDEKNAGNRTVNYTGVTLSGEEAGNYSIATTATGNGTISRKALELVADHVSTQYGDYIPATFTGSVTGFVAGEGIGSGDTLLFALSDPSASAVGSYGVTGTINGSASGNYGLNYTFSNAASNANAFVITARPASVQDMVLSDIIPGIKGMDGANISVKALDNAMAQAAPNVKEAGIEFAIAQSILPVDAVRSMSLENNGMKQPSAMTAQEVAEQVSAQQGNGGLPTAQVDGQQGEGGLPAAQVNDTAGTPGAQVNGNVGITGNEGATGATGNGTSPAGVNENGVASNAGDTGSLNAALDMVQQTDDAVGTEESKKKKGAA